MENNVDLAKLRINKAFDDVKETIMNTSFKSFYKQLDNQLIELCFLINNELNCLKAKMSVKRIERVGPEPHILWISAGGIFITGLVLGYVLG